MNQLVSKYLFPEERTNTYAVIDGASAPDLLDKLYGLRPEFVCLFRGELDSGMAEVAPYLVRLDAQTEFARWVIDIRMGESLGSVRFEPRRHAPDAPSFSKAAGGL